MKETTHIGLMVSYASPDDEDLGDALIVRRRCHNGLGAHSRQARDYSNVQPDLIAFLLSQGKVPARCLEQYEVVRHRRAGIQQKISSFVNVVYFNKKVLPF